MRTEAAMADRLVARAQLLFWSLVNRLRRSFDESVEHSLPHLPYLGVIGAVGFPLYYYVWTVPFPQPYENLGLRLFGCVLFLAFVFVRRWPVGVRRYIRPYWLFSFTFALPFFFTFMLLKNDGNIVWAMSTMAALALLILVAYDWVLAIATFIVGSVFAFGAYWLTTDQIALPQSYLVQLPVYAFLLVAGSVFNYKSIRLKQEKLKVLATVGSDIAHELRTPLLAINNYIDGVSDYLPVLIDSHRRARQAGLDVADIRPDRFEALSRSVEQIEKEVRHSNVVIEMLLMNVGKANIDVRRFDHYWIANVIDEALERYPFKSEAERRRIHLSIDDDFCFYGSDRLIIHVLFNLMKNSLRYINEAGKGHVSIRIERDRGCNRLYFRDTAIGMPMSELAAIFDHLYTSQIRSSGTGIGLAFCKRVMESFRGSIVCRSKPGEYAEFELRFPATD